MVRSGVTLKVLSPRAEVESVPQSSASPRLANLAGKKIGILQNTKGGAEMLVPYLQKALKARVPDIELRKWIVPHQQPEEEKVQVLKEIADYSDGVVALIGD